MMVYGLMISWYGRTVVSSIQTGITGLSENYEADLAAKIIQDLVEKGLLEWDKEAHEVSISTYGNGCRIILNKVWSVDNE